MRWNYQGRKIRGRDYEEDYSGNVARFDERLEMRGRRRKMETLDMEIVIHGWGVECNSEGVVRGAMEGNGGIEIRYPNPINFLLKSNHHNLTKLLLLSYKSNNEMELTTFFHSSKLSPLY